MNRLDILAAMYEAEQAIEKNGGIVDMFGNRVDAPFTQTPGQYAYTQTVYTGHVAKARSKKNRKWSTKGKKE